MFRRKHIAQGLHLNYISKLLKSIIKKNQNKTKPVYIQTNRQNIYHVLGTKNTRLINRERFLYREQNLKEKEKSLRKPSIKTGY